MALHFKCPVAVLPCILLLTTACPLPAVVTPCSGDLDCPAHYSCNPITASCKPTGLLADAGAADGAARDGARADGSGRDHPSVDHSALDRAGHADAGLSPDRHRSWTLVEDAGQPGALLGPKTAFHRNLGQVMLYGGSTGNTSGPYSAALWRYDGTAWIPECDDCEPGPRWGHALVYDVSGDRLLLFGGTRDNTTAENDLWQWTRSSGFVLLAPGGEPPPPRDNVFAAFDETRQRLVVFGGVREDTGVTDELWEFDGVQWHHIAATTPWPVRRNEHGQGATYDRLARGVVIYGGYDVEYSAGFDDMWSWDGAAWTQRCAACTGNGRAGAGVAYDPATGRIVLQGGFTTSEQAGTWCSTATGFVLVDAELPPARDTGALVYDERRDVFVLYGGNRGGNGGNRAETYEYR